MYMCNRQRWARARYKERRSFLLERKHRSIYPRGAGAALQIVRALLHFAAPVLPILYLKKCESLNRSTRTKTDLNMLKQT